MLVIFTTQCYNGIVLVYVGGNMKHIELLAPAGDMECLEAAVRFGADAVYLGGDLLQLRAQNAGFSREKLADAVSFIHKHGKRLYVTVNSFANNHEIGSCSEYARFLHDIGIDAVIISDLGVLAEFGEAAPDLERHISTQANCMNYRTAQVYASMGAKRIVLAREMPLEDIADLHDRLGDTVELEAFIHGAMCMAYSGRCLISSYLTGRSGNRGACTQPCRWSYTLMEEKRPGEYFPIEETDKGFTILSSHDLCCIDLLDELASAGVSSFKIEGRMKSAYYVATAVNAYRRAMDRSLPIDVCRNELNCLQHRPYSTGFYHGALTKGHYNDGLYRSECRFMANVLGWKDGVLKLRQRNNFKVGDELEVLSPNAAPFSFAVTSIQNEDGEYQQTAPHPNQIIFVPCEKPLEEGDILRRRENVTVQA